MSEPVTMDQIDDATNEDAVAEVAKKKDVDHVFKWAEPPAAPKRTGGAGRAVSQHWLTVAATLREHSGEWAQVSEHDSSLKASSHAARIRAGKSKAFEPKDHFHTTVRPLDGDEENEPTSWAVFARHTAGSHLKDEAKEGDSETVTDTTDDAVASDDDGGVIENIPGFDE